MGFLIGTDEAGYGPNLGPLVVAATVWEVDMASWRSDLYERLGGAVCREWHEGDPRLSIADSKQLYRPAGSLAPLETGVLSSLAQTDRLAEGSDGLWSQLCPTAARQMCGLPWYADQATPIPVASERAEIERHTAGLRSALLSAGIRLVTIRCAALFPPRFNQLVERYASKATVLSEATLQLVSQLIHALPAGPVRVVCDKHGGRNRYAGLLQPLFQDRLIRVQCETRRESAYRLDLPEQPIEISFRAGGEEFLPSALASMTAKYLRELAMRCFNAFWARQVSDLRPTAGYPVDAKRFKREISRAQGQLGIHDATLWRCR